MGESSSLTDEDEGSTASRSPPAKRPRIASPNPAPAEPAASTTKPRKTATDVFGSAGPSAESTVRSTRSKTKKVLPAAGFDNLPAINDTHLTPGASSAAARQADKKAADKAAAAAAKKAAKARDKRDRRDAKGKNKEVPDDA